MLKKIWKFLFGPYIHEGTVENIELTFGGAGNQIITIDGVKYAMWLDYTEFPKLGEKVMHEPYMSTRYGKRMFCTRILKQPEHS